MRCPARQAFQLLATSRLAASGQTSWTQRARKIGFIFWVKNRASIFAAKTYELLACGRKRPLSGRMNGGEMALLAFSGSLPGEFLSPPNSS
jgi:hypothetical protein